DRIADELPGAMVGHVAAAARLEQPDAGLRQLDVAPENVGTRVAHLDAQRHDVGMLEQDERVVDFAGLATLDQAPLQLDAVLVRQAAVLDDVQPAHQDGQFSIACLTRAMNASATAPST